MPSVNESLSQSHTSRNFVVTPPQTESAQILLALARSCSKKQYFHSAESVAGSGTHILTPTLGTINNHDYNCDFRTNEKVVKDDTLFGSECGNVDRHLPTSISSHEDYEVESASNAAVNKQLTSVTNNLPLASTVITTTSAAASLSASSVIADEIIVPENKSLLAKLLTRNSVPSQCKMDDIVHYDEDCKLLYAPSTQVTTPISTTSEHQSDLVVEENSKKNTFELQSDILECPFLIETNDGYVDMAVDNMLNVFDNTEIFDSCIGKTSTLKIVTPKIECLNADDIYKHGDQVSETNCCSKIESFEDDILERIKQEEDEDELKDDPDAVVLRRINENGELEKYVLSSIDIATLKVMIEQRKQQASVNSTDVKTDIGITAATTNTAANSASMIKTTTTSSSTSISTSHVEVVLPSTRGSTSLITRVINAGIKVENAISRLPFKKSRSCWTPEISTCDSTSNNSISNSSSNTISNGNNSANNNGNSNNSNSSNDMNSCCSHNNITSTVIPSTSMAVSSCNAGVNGTSSEYVSSVGSNSERILDGTSLTVDSHHENMFEELDNQLNMVDCSMENIQREYVAYEEASKNETQIDHNYYANAMKDEDEECVVISDNFNLGSMMLIDKSLGDTTSAGFVSLSHTINKRSDTSNSLALSLPKNKIIPVTAVGDNKHDLYLDKCDGAGDSNDNKKKSTVVAISAVDTTVTTPSRRNGFVNKVPLSVSVPVSTMTESMSSIPVSIFSEKCGLIVNNDVLMDSVTNTTIMTATTTVAHAMITNRSNSVTTTSATSTASTTIKAQYTPSKPFFSIVATTINSVSVGALTPRTTAITTFSNMSVVTKTKPSVVNGLSSTFKPSTGLGVVKRKSRNHSLENGGPIKLPFKKVKNSTTNSTDLCSTTATAAITSATAVSTAAVQISKKGRRTYKRKLGLSNDNTDYECVTKSKEFSNSNVYVNMNTNGDGGIFYEPITTNNNNNNLIEEIIVDEIS